MIVLVLILLIAIVGATLRIGLIEFALGILLATPIVWQVLTRVFVVLGMIDAAPSPQIALFTYVLILLLLFGVSYLIFPRRGFREIQFSELFPLGIWAACFVFALYFCHSWPDFYQSGERLRDYALLAASVKSPVVPSEPWMSGATINYYIYWYRFGHMLSTLGGLPVWELYHTLVAFSISMYVTLIYRLLSQFLGLRAAWALIVSIAIAFGSNVKGIIDWWNVDHNWWGPSRVVKGAINEFPAWSFLLGDLHPHYANLCAIPFLILIIGTIWRSQLAVGEKSIYSILVGLLGHFFLFGSNAWEIPMWWGILLSFIVAIAARPHSPLAEHSRRTVLEWWKSLNKKDSFAASLAIVACILSLLTLLVFRKKISTALFLGIATGILGFASFFVRPQAVLKSIGELRGGVNWKRVVAFSVFFFVLISGCILGSRHIVPEGGELRFVRNPIELTTVSEMFLHWGIPAAIIAVCTPLLFESILVGIVVFIAIGVTLLINDAAVFLYLVAFLQLVRLTKDSTVPVVRAVLGNGILLAGLGLVLLPEFVFLDDPYGGENERMNTIFKIYTTAWFLLHVGSVFLLTVTVEKVWKAFKFGRVVWIEYVGLLVPLAAGFVMIGFFGQTVDLRRVRAEKIEPYTRGLSTVAALFPGSKEVIDFLTTQPSSVVLEAQGNAYDYTTFVSTLSGQTAFLGWSNHVGLLTKKYDEVSRREKVTESFYNAGDCSARRAIMVREGIGFVVVGTLEKKKYSGLRMDTFSCLDKVMGIGDYSLYR